MLSTISRFLDHYSLRPSEPERQQLREIARAFSHLPYENVTKILKDARSSNSKMKGRATDEVLEDHLKWNTGGTCFSLCNALLDILESSGFSSHIAMADMHYGSNIHCAVVVRLNARHYLLDPGYLLHQPIPLPPSRMQTDLQTPMNTIILRNETPGIFSLYTEENGQTKWRYRLRANPIRRDEFKQHWIHSFSLNTMDHLMLSSLTDSGRLYFRKDRLEHVHPGARIRRKITGFEAAELSTVFGVPSDLIAHAQKVLLSRL